MQRSRPTLFSSLMLMILLTALSVSRAQADLSINLKAGAWLPLLPDYEALSIVPEGGGMPIVENVFSDSQSGLGTQFGFSTMFNFEGTRTSFESDTVFASVDSMKSSAALIDPDGPAPAPVPGGTTIWLPSLNGIGGNLFTEDTGFFNVAYGGDVRYFNKYFGLRDRFDLSGFGLGVLDLGCGFNFMTFDQDHSLVVQVATGASGFYEEGVDSTYIGGQVRATFNRVIAGTNTRLDVNVGLYNMEADYRGYSRLTNMGGMVFDTDMINLESSDVAASIDIALKADFQVCGFLLRPMLGLQILTEMAKINHPQTITITGPPVSLGTKSGYMLNGGFEGVF